MAEDLAKVRARQKRVRENRAQVRTPFWLTLDNETLAELRRLHGRKHGGVTEAIRTYIEWGLEIEREKPAPLPSNGWHMHGCGQWVHDKLAPCSVCREGALR